MKLLESDNLTSVSMNCGKLPYAATLLCATGIKGRQSHLATSSLMMSTRDSGIDPTLE